MAAIRPLDQVAKKWASVTPARTGDYEAGVAAPRVDWSRAAAAANPAWKDGVAKAVQADSFAKGVTRAGTERWQRGASVKGVQRWGPGVQIAEGDYRDGFAPYHSAIAAVTLPPRYARRDPRNLDRVKAVVDAIVRVKAGR